MAKWNTETGQKCGMGFARLGILVAGGLQCGGMEGCYMRQYYIGHNKGTRHLFYSDSPVTEQTHGHLYAAVIGPFRTKRGALFMLECGGNNPHCRSVADAERLALAHRR